MWVTLATIVFLIFAFSFVLYLQNQKIPQLGHSEGALSPMPDTPNAVSTQTQEASKRVEPLPFKLDTSATMAAIVTIVKQHEEAEIITQQPNYLYAVFTSKLCRFHDDVEFYLDEKTRLVHFRSASRAGRSDLGVNRNRYDALVKAYNAI